MKGKNFRVAFAISPRKILRCSVLVPFTDLLNKISPPTVAHQNRKIVATSNKGTTTVSSTLWSSVCVLSNLYHGGYSRSTLLGTRQGQP